MKKLIFIYKGALVATLCSSAIIGALLPTPNSYADDFMNNWMINTGFKDPALFNCVFNEYLYANNISEEDIYNEIGPSGALPASGLANIDYLYCDYRGITDTSGLEKLPNLSFLNLYHNQITSIDLSKNTKLVNVRLDYNYLSSIDLSANTQLRRLGMSYNHLTSANLYYNTNLSSLTINGNYLTTLDLSNSPLLIDLTTDNIEIVTSARAKKTENNYTFHFPLPYYHSSEIEIIATEESVALQSNTKSPFSFSRWFPRETADYYYDYDSESFITNNRNVLSSGFSLQSFSSSESSSEVQYKSTASAQTVTINSRPVSIVPSVVVDDTTYTMPDTATIPAKYIGESWDSNDYREVVDQILATNNKEDVKLTKIEIYNSLENAPMTNTGLNSDSSQTHLFGTIPDIEVPMASYTSGTINDSTPSYEAPVNLLNLNVNSNAIYEGPDVPPDLTFQGYNPEVILAPGTPDFRIVYYFETVDSIVDVPNTGASSRWGDNEVSIAMPLFAFVALAFLATGSITHIINCQKRKVHFKKPSRDL